MRIRVGPETDFAGAIYGAGRTAAETEVGRGAIVELLRCKLERRAANAEQLKHLKATVRVKDAKPIAVAHAIRGWARQLDPALSFSRLREIESSAGRTLWQTISRYAPRFDRGFVARVPSTGTPPVHGPRDWTPSARERRSRQCTPPEPRVRHP
jgi:hypothetical protein